jgi:hypothetical protein
VTLLAPIRNLRKREIGSIASRFNVDFYNETKIETGIGMLPQHNLLASAPSASPNQRKNILPAVVHL